MAKESRYTPEELARRMDELESGTGQPYQPGEDPAVDAAMHLRNAAPPTLSDEKIAAIGAGLLMAASAAQPPILNNEAFNQIGTELQAQTVLQSAPQPVLSEEALNRIGMELRLRAAPQPTMSNEALVRIEQQLLQVLKPNTIFLNIAGVILAVLGGLLALTVLLNDAGTEEIPTDIVDIEESAESSEVAESEYTTAIYFEVVSHPTDDSENAAEAEEVIPTAEPTADVEVVVEADEPATIPSIAEVMQLPSAIVAEGTIESIDDDSLVIYGMTYSFEHDTSIADDYVVGDIVHIEGAVSPLNTNLYVILSIEPVIDMLDERPILTTIGIEPEPDDDGDGSNTDITVTTTGSVVTGSTGAATIDVNRNDECADGDDRNLGRGQECNPGQEPSGGQSSGRGQP